MNSFWIFIIIYGAILFVFVTISYSLFVYRFHLLTMELSKGRQRIKKFENADSVKAKLFALPEGSLNAVLTRIRSRPIDSSEKLLWIGFPSHFRFLSKERRKKNIFAVIGLIGLFFVFYSWRFSQLGWETVFYLCYSGSTPSVVVVFIICYYLKKIKETTKTKNKVAFAISSHRIFLIGNPNEHSIFSWEISKISTIFARDEKQNSKTLVFKFEDEIEEPEFQFLPNVDQINLFIEELKKNLLNNKSNEIDYEKLELSNLQQIWILDSQVIDEIIDEDGFMELFDNRKPIDNDIEDQRLMETSSNKSEIEMIEDKIL
ncbi:hypothetical protein M0811_01786 [Anaeramoeba ignava]|uniref:Uncharacterized protein n=1 Tax=Anaeramoeba ignava TaxID=1746090 RepID=A0A9Q0LGH8_ANAIG|nr:hypothetical protein M0811_01786 [Anaeramoeba ignava]